MEKYIIPILIFAILGAIAGILLTVASKVFAVKTDKRIEQINESLPQVNCGACGYAGCADYANAIIKNNVEPNLCKPGGAETIQAISEILGVTAQAFTPEVAVLHCNGNCNATSQKYEYDGINSCLAKSKFFNGDGLCAYGCLGLGDCIEACDGNAITIQNGIANIDKSQCIACGRCVKACPNNLISLRPVTKHIDVLCSSKDNGKVTKSACKNGCIGCKICEKKCPQGAIKVIDFHAIIDYDKCINCDICYNSCPTKAIGNCQKG